MHARQEDVSYPTSPPPRTHLCGTDDGRLLAPGRPFAFPTEVSGVMNGRVFARYSGGAAPASHRFPSPPSEFSCKANLLDLGPARKRGDEFALERGAIRLELRTRGIRDRRSRLQHGIDGRDLSRQCGDGIGCGRRACDASLLRMLCIPRRSGVGGHRDGRVWRVQRRVTRRSRAAMRRRLGCRRCG